VYWWRLNAGRGERFVDSPIDPMASELIDVLSPGKIIE
jgi:hypothetical protein